MSWIEWKDNGIPLLVVYRVRDANVNCMCREGIFYIDGEREREGERNENTSRTNCMYCLTIEVGGGVV